MFIILNMNNKHILKYFLSAGVGLLAFKLSLKIEDKNFRMAAAGLLAQVTADFLFHPIDLVNTRTKYFYMEKVKTLTIAKRILNTTGPRGFFRGGTVTIFGSSVSGSVYFYFYKRIKDYMKNLLDKEPNLYFIAYTVSSFVSEVIVYLFYYPFDLIKTRIQTGQYEYKNLFDALNQICDKNDIKLSIKNLYTGFIPSLTLCTTSTTLTFFVFEITRDHFAKKRNISSEEVSGIDYFVCTLITGVVTAFSLNFLEVYTIQKIVHGKDFNFKTFIKPKHFIQATTSGLLARNVYGIFYTVCWLELIKMFGKIYDVSL
jgi:hypothetical protein